MNRKTIARVCEITVQLLLMALAYTVFIGTVAVAWWVAEWWGLLGFVIVAVGITWWIMFEDDSMAEEVYWQERREQK